MHFSSVSIESITDFLLPLLMQLPTRGPSTSTHRYFSTLSHKASSVGTRDVLNVLEYCTEQLPTCVNTPQIPVDGSLCKSTKEMGLCSQLPSSESYRNFKLQRVCY